MTRAYKLHIAGTTAMIALLLGGPSTSFAQDAAPVVAAPPQSAPVQQAPAPVAATPTVTPPPVVPTLPTENGRVNAAAAEAAAAEAAENRKAVAATTSPAKARTVARAVPVVATTATRTTDAIAPNSDVAAPADIVTPTVGQIAPADAIVDAVPVTPVEQPVAVEGGIGNEDLILFGGLAAALAAIGVGASFARRRRKIANDNVVYATAPVADNAEPRPIKEDPAFQQLAARPIPEPFIAREAAVKPPKVVTRPDLPITDPLFGREVVAPPIIDPMFAPRNEVEPPITDPLFAKHDRFAGRARTTEPVTTRTSELVN